MLAPASSKPLLMACIACAGSNTCVCVQVNGGKLPPHVVPFCAGGAALAALLPVASELLQRGITARTSSEPEGQGEGSSRQRPSRLSQTSQASLLSSLLEERAVQICSHGAGPAWGCAQVSSSRVVGAPAERG